ncbi:eCIS core domain-containing protein, partial [Parapedobacter tibetensis]|uniref:eCIS core domain-containing protein n=1 Tax=Parapedobacter tibetensis TaxID=2972951 RepID=UPI00214DDD42
FFQSKLTVNQPNDPYEQEADMMADRVMRMADVGIQRKCTHCEEEEKQIHRKESRDSTPQVQPGFERYVSHLNGGGRALSIQERSFFEPRFDRDFSDVRIHTDSSAAESAQSINALAYTTGNNIV